MKNYKYSATSKAVGAIYNYFSEATLLYEQLENTKPELSQQGYETKRQALQEDFRQIYRSTRQAIDAAVKEAQARVEAAKSSYLTLGNAAMDYQLLSLPVPLTADDLRTLAKRNADNPLFLRSVGQYAKEHGMLEDRSRNRDLANLQYANSGAEELTRRADFLNATFNKYASDDDFIRVVKGYGRRAFADIESKIDFTEY